MAAAGGPDDMLPPQDDNTRAQGVSTVAAPFPEPPVSAQRSTMTRSSTPRDPREANTAIGAAPTNPNEEAEEEPVCRVCHMEAEPDEGRPLFHPCLCRGSIKHVHQDCLLQWLAASRNTAQKCELCGKTFIFSPIYAPGAPEELSSWEMMQGLSEKVVALGPHLVRGGVLCLLWLGVMPYLSLGLFQIYFAMSWEEAWKVWKREVVGPVTMVLGLGSEGGGEGGWVDGLGVLVWQSVGGLALCATIVTLCLMAITVKDFLAQMMRGWRRRGRVEGGVRRGGGGARRQGIQHARQEQPQPPQPPPRPPQQEEVPIVEYQHGPGAGDGAGAGAAPAVGAAANAVVPIIPPAPPAPVAPAAPVVAPVAPAAPHVVFADPNHQGQQGQQQQQQEVPLREMLDADMDEVDLWELLGFNSPWSLSLRRWGSVLLFNWVFLTVFQLGPFRLGCAVWGWVLRVEALYVQRVQQRGGGGGGGGDMVSSWVVSKLIAVMEGGAKRRNGSSSSLPFSSFTSSLRDALLTQLQALIEYLIFPTHHISPSPPPSSRAPSPPRLSALSNNASSSRLVHSLGSLLPGGGDNSSSSSPSIPPSSSSPFLLDHLALLSVGYVTLFFVLVLSLLFLLFLHTLFHPHAAVRSLRRASSFLSHVSNLAKHTLLLLLDLLFLPQAFGWALDLSTLPLFAPSTLKTRVKFLKAWPFVSLAAHWLGGFTFLALAGLVAMEFRRVLRPDVLRGVLLQPGEGMEWEEDAGGQAGREGGQSVLRYARRLLVSMGLVYGPLLLLAVYSPIHFGHHLLLPFSLLLGLPPPSPLHLTFLPSFQHTGSSSSATSSSSSSSSPSFSSSTSNSTSPAPLYLELQLPIELFLFHIALPLLLERFRLRNLIREGVEKGFASLCLLFGLGPSLLDMDTLRQLQQHPQQQQQNQPPQRVEGGEGGNGDGNGLAVAAAIDAPAPPLAAPQPLVIRPEPAEGEGGRKERKEERAFTFYPLRVVGLCISMSVGVVIVASLVVQVPLRVGREGLRRLGLPTGHDVYNLAVGFLLVFLIGSGLGKGWQVLVGGGGGGGGGAAAGAGAAAGGVQEAPAEALAGRGGQGGGQAQQQQEEGQEQEDHRGQEEKEQENGRQQEQQQQQRQRQQQKQKANPLALLLTCVRTHAHARLTHLGRVLPPLWRTLLLLSQSLLLLFLWLLVLPLLVGLLFELVLVIPARVPIDETPLLPFYEAWALGLIFLKIQARCLLLGLYGNDHPWKRKFERVRANGFRGLEFWWTLTQVVLPVLLLFLSLLLTPYFLSKTVEKLAHLYLRHGLGAPVPHPALPRFLARFLAPVWYRQQQQRDLHEASILLLVAGMKRYVFLYYSLYRGSVKGWLWVERAWRQLHDRLRDDAYLVGMELKNYSQEEGREEG